MREGLVWRLFLDYSALIGLRGTHDRSDQRQEAKD